MCLIRTHPGNRSQSIRGGLYRKARGLFQTVLVGVNVATLTKGRRQNLYTLCGYLLILLALIAAALVLGTVAYFFVIVPGGRPSHDSVTRWTGLTVLTAVIFGYVINRSQRHWRAWVFWRVIAGLLAIHIGFFLILFYLIDHWTYVWFFLIPIVEGPFTESVANWGIRQFSIVQGH